MAILNERIKEMRIKRNLTLLQLAELLGVQEATVQRYESGAIKNIKYETVVSIAEILNCSPVYLMGWSNDPYIKEALAEQSACRSYPVIGEVAAGFGSEAVEEETGDYEQIPIEWLRGHNPDNFFVLRVKGDSMYPDFQDGDHVLVHRQNSVDSGAVAVMLYDSEVATLKKVRYKKGEDWVELIPRNPEYQTKRIENWDLNECRVLGEVRRLIRIVR